MNDITLIIPYFEQPAMLRAQLDTVAEYPEIAVIVVDDCSRAHPAEEVFEAHDRAALYRIDTDIPWNRGGARNLGTMEARSTWVLHVDTDHILPPDAAAALLDCSLQEDRWYRFPRYRMGRADETRRKDGLPDDAEFGPIHPHIDSHLMTRNRFLCSPYDERYSGCLGGGTPFLSRMERLYGPSTLLPAPICLHVYTRHKIKDASVSLLSRDTNEYRRRRQRIGRNDAPIRPINFEWHRVR